jgi:hypothetical protein
MKIFLNPISDIIYLFPPTAVFFPSNERPRGKPCGIKERNPQEHTQQAAGYSSSRESGINPDRSAKGEKNLPHSD